MSYAKLLRSMGHGRKTGWRLPKLAKTKQAKISKVKTRNAHKHEKRESKVVEKKEKKQMEIRSPPTHSWGYGDRPQDREGVHFV